MSSNTYLSNFTLSKDDIISERLNVILQNFAANDNAVYNKFDEIPGVWRCLWYNDSEIKGHNRGDFFWLNTESKMDFLKNNAKQIQEDANMNPAISAKLPNWRSNDEDIFNMYNNVLTGYIDPSKSAPLQAWAELGQLSACVQLVISKKNDNKEPIWKTDYWKKFIIDEDDVESIAVSTQLAVSSAVTQHEYDYHFGEDRVDEASFRGKVIDTINNLTSYVDKTFVNVDNMYPQNYLTADYKCSGFDTVEYFVKKPYPDRAHEGWTVEYQWFRKWRSGFLEHGGLLKTLNCIDDSKSNVSIKFNWTLSGDAANMYHVRYLASDGELVEIDESNENPPGDNILSVLYQLDPEMFEIKTAPVYYAGDYVLNLTPIYKTSGISCVGGSSPYEGLGNYAAARNVVNTVVDNSAKTKTGFSFPYDSVNTPEYYMYYTTGYCIG